MLFVCKACLLIGVVCVIAYAILAPMDCVRWSKHPEEYPWIKGLRK